MEQAYERLLRYVKIYTTSDERSGTHPSAARELTLAHLLTEELHAIGLTDAAVDEHGYVYAHLPATSGYEGAPALGFIAHMDTAPDFSGEGVKPRLIPNYDGGDVPLGDSGRVLSVKDFPHLGRLAGRTLMVTDGTTLLGADDKAGIAEIMTAVERLVTSGAPHGALSVGFTPDEEIGEGADLFDVARFGAKFAYTVDGGEEGILEYENFNAAGAKFTVHGVNVHPGSAKGIMVNAGLIAAEIAASLPAEMTPQATEGYEGFFHLCHMTGSVEEATLEYIVRDHDAEKFEEKKAYLAAVADLFNRRYGTGTVTLTVRDQYRNMKEKILPHRHLIDNAMTAAERAGAVPGAEAIRGGTDGARLSFMGLPCPNLGTGGYAFHGPFEHITVEGMEISTRIIEELIRIYTGKKD